MPNINYESYWDHNIDKWGELYLEISHGDEALSAPRWFSKIYNASIGRLEAKLMKDRYNRTVEFLDEYLDPGMVLTDVGCGTGIFVVRALKNGASVNAVDFAARALEITKMRVDQYSPSNNVKYLQLDVQKKPIPESDVAIAMGVAPYISDLPAFLMNILPRTKLFFCLFIDPDHWANQLRSALGFLNVRELQFHSRKQVDAIYSQLDWKLLNRTNFATGYIDIAIAASCPPDLAKKWLKS